MKKTLALLPLILGFFAVKAQDQPKSSKVSLSFNQGLGFSNPQKIDNQRVNSYYFAEQGLALNSKIELTYNFKEKTGNQLFISSGLNSITYSLTGYSDRTHQINYSASYLQLPLSIGISSKHGVFSSFISLGMYANIGAQGSVVRHDDETNRTTKRNVTSTSAGLQSRIGVKLNIKPRIFYLISMDISADIGTGKYINGGYFFTNGLGLNF